MGCANMNVEIDKLTPCLERVSTGEIVKTSYSKIDKSEINSLNGWLFSWSSPSLNDSEIYKIIVEDDNRIQGLVALRDDPDMSAIYVKITESAPHNKGKDKEYVGTGGHLFAVAALVSLNRGYGGFIYMDAKNKRLVDHYIEILGASFVGGVHPYRLSVNEVAARKLIEFYNFKGKE